MVAAALGTRLRLAGYSVSAKADPGSAIKSAKLQRPDLIIADLNLPTMDGLTLVQKLKELGFGDVPFLVVTASYHDGLWESAMKCGATAYFEKPYDPERLMASVAGILNPPKNQNTQRTHL